MEGSVPMVYVPYMLPIVWNELGKACFKGMISWATAVDGVDVSARLGVRGLRADLGFLAVGVEGEQGLFSLREDLG